MVKEKRTVSNKNKIKQKHFSKKGLKIFVKQVLIWVVIFTFLLSFVVPLSFALVFRNRVFPNIKVGNSNLSGKTKLEAISLIKDSYKNLSSTEFHLSYEGKEWVYHAADWNIKIDFEKSVDNAFALGRNPSVITNISTIIKAQKEIINIPLVLTLDEQLFASTTALLAEEIEIPMISPNLVVEKKKIVVTPGSIGRKLEKEMLLNIIVQTINQNTSFNITLPVVKLNPPVGKNEEEQAFQRASSLLPKKLELTIGDSFYEVENQELVNLLSFLGGFDTEKVASLTANLAKAYDKQPQNAAFNFENGRVTIFKPGKEGQTINQESSIPLIVDILTKLESTTSSELTINVPVSKTPPEISTDEVNDLGIRELIGKGVSYFRGSIASRVHNIVLASSKLNGLLIKPGETFSFNQAVGDISAATGYQQAYIIQNGRTVLGDGGGVCQVSTTLFRAALNAGLPIVERTAHAYRVAYYEQGFGAGLDATVFAPSVDLKFKNDTPTHILIQTIADPANSTLTFELYGASDGRVSYVSTPRVWDQTPPPPPRYEDDPTLPIGQEKQVDWAAWGAKAAFDYKVTRGGETLINRTFYSNFRPWQAVFLRGTKP